MTPASEQHAGRLIGVAIAFSLCSAQAGSARSTRRSTFVAATAALRAMALSFVATAAPPLRKLRRMQHAQLSVHRRHAQLALCLRS